MLSLIHAFRTLFRTPFVTVVAILSLALGIGANAAIYSLFDQMLLRPLPVSQPNRLVNLKAPGPNPGSQSCTNAGGCDEVFSYPMFRDLEASHTGFSGIAAHRSFGANVAYKNQTLSGDAMYVSGSYFPVLDVHAARGRLFTQTDDRAVGSNYVTVLGYDYWQTKLGADPNVIGQAITVNGQHLTILGVAPEGFQGTTLGTKPMLYVPISMRGVLENGFVGFQNRRTYWIYLFARLAPGVSTEQAAKAVNTVYHGAINDVEAPLQTGMSAATMVKFRAKEIALDDGRRGQSGMHAQTRTPLILLFSITAVVLLIACANIANLLLARSAGRATEMAVRLSLGATRQQLLRQLLTESCLLAVLGGIVSLLVANITIGVLSQILPSDKADALGFALHWNVVGFTALVSIGTGFLFGLYPALQSTKPDLVTTLRAGSGKLAGERSSARFRTSLVTAQIALSTALLVSAGLFVKSLVHVATVNLGLNVDRVVTFSISPELNGYKNAQSAQFFMRLEEQLAAIPGVNGVSSSLVPLLAGSNWGSDVSVQGFKKGPDTDANSRYNEVGPGYFSTLGMTVLNGREFTASDVSGASKVAVVNETFAKKFGLGRDAVGKFIGSGGNDSLNMQIVGLIKDAKYSGVKQEMQPLFMTPTRQDSTLGSLNFYVRTAADPAQLIRAIPGIVSKLDPNLPVDNLKTMPQQIKENVFLDRMISSLSGAFATLATLLAAIGLYGVLAYSVAQRTREIGVRMALGADMGSVRAMIMRQVAWMTLIGCAIGLAGAVLVGRGAASLLYQMTGFDPVIFGGAAVVLAIVALGAGYVPARRASRVDPMQALRYE
ncbi:MAG TPA: ABC transporter permease [Gemmatimonadaceae bacterium]|jgi:predicted permease